MATPVGRPRAAPRSGRRRGILDRVRIRVTPAWVWPFLVASALLVVVSAAAVAALETHTVGSFWRGMWWSVSLVTTVGFIGEPPETRTGALLSVALMVTGFLLMAMVSASLAALFVRQEESPFEAREERLDQQILSTLRRLEDRVAALEAALGQSPAVGDGTSDGTDVPPSSEAGPPEA